MIRQESKLETLKRFLSQRSDASIKEMYTRCLIGDECKSGACLWHSDTTDKYCNAIRDEFVKRGFDENG